MNIAIVSLGCPKNQCDADVMAASLLQAGHALADKAEEADLILVNTCGFIESAKQEAIDNILEACKYKTQNEHLKVVVTGCLAQRYGQEMVKEIPECDAVVGIGANAQIAEIIEKLQTGEKVLALPEKEKLPIAGERIISTPIHYAYLKIAEGCTNKCHYCAIPLIRGKLRSRPFKETIEEAKWLAAQGVKEVILVAQDITAYGEDLTGERMLPNLLREIEQIESIRWIRLLYAYPERITDELIETMASSKKILPYIDIPIQHINSEVLTNMNRRGDRNTVISAVERLRAGIPNVCIRTTLISGYPGETEEQFEELLSFVKEYKIERLGCFAFSQEEGTVAAEMKNQVPIEVRINRAEKIMEIQADVMMQKQAELVGTIQEVICDEYNAENDVWICRTKRDAPEIDGVCYVKSDIELEIGNFYNVIVEDSDVYDLYASYVEEAGN